METIDVNKGISIFNWVIIFSCVSYLFFGASSMSFSVVVGLFVARFYDDNQFKIKFLKSKLGKLGLANVYLVQKVIYADRNKKRREFKFAFEYFESNFGLNISEQIVKCLQFEQFSDSFKGIHQACEFINKYYNKEKKIELVEFLFSITAADNNIHIHEVSLIKSICRFLKISNSEFESLKEKYINEIEENKKIEEEAKRKAQEKTSNNQYSYYNSYNTQTNTFSTAYSVLGLTSNATIDEIKQAYRNLAKIYHPDKVSFKGEEFRKKALIKFQDINQAYDRLKKLRDFN